LDLGQQLEDQDALGNKQLQLSVRIRSSYECEYLFLLVFNTQIARQSKLDSIQDGKSKDRPPKFKAYPLDGLPYQSIE
jgi:hypothetical protein